MHIYNIAPLLRIFTGHQLMSHFYHHQSHHSIPFHHRLLAFRALSQFYNIQKLIHLVLPHVSLHCALNFLVPLLHHLLNLYFLALVRLLI